jgi:VWFA-related protein
MHNRAALSLAMVILVVGLGALPIASVAWAQSAPREKPKLKDFGSSLERLKWDARQNAAVETKRRKKEKERGADEEEVVRVETSLVVCDVLVLDKQGRAVKGLTPDDFVLKEDGRPQQVGTFALGDNAQVGRTIVLIIDYSGSQFPFIRTSVAAAKTLVDKLGPRDTMAIVTDDIELLADFTRDKERLKKKLDSLEKSATAEESLNPFSQRRRFGRSAQYSALMATLKEAFDTEDQRPIIIFQTDGDELSLLRNPVITPSLPPNLPPDMLKEAQKNLERAIKFQHDNMREFSLDDIYTAAEKSRATIYTIIPGFRLIGLTPDEQVKQLNAQAEISMTAWGVKPEMRARLAALEKKVPPEVWQHRAERALKVQLALAGVAQMTGGWTDFLEDPSQADAVYSRIFSDINLRYVIGYYPTNKEHDGKQRRVSIEVLGHPEYTIWGRKSYYAQGPDE